ncbi:unnamed protein product [Allacma fusca]|uniref:Orn/DAP/Arg decarboxylase 2 N-terminal domain-containing protein n=1 Tax=Allacma fusca TaxID=39272 RepID=A0A8J2JR36_9HEXA|nr:unnamed protein product [Allacma fusca]
MGTPPFYFQDGILFCEQVDIGELVNSLPTRIHQIPIQGKFIQTEVATTPFFLYSKAALRNNTRSYFDAMRTHNLNGALGYAVKANGNLNILEELKSLGVEMLITVSGYEILAGLKVGFLPRDIIFNGNGKQRWEIKLAIEHGILLNVDSVFDAEQILEISGKEFPQKEVQVLLRVQPPPFECNVAVHPYVNTSESSKFGFDTRDMNQILEILQEHEKIKVYGIHCHLGSCIYDPQVYEYIAGFVTDLSATLAKNEIHVKLLDIGGGIGINYHGTLPEPMSRILPKTLKVLLEPGRSLVGNSAVLVTKVLGTKRSRNKNYVIVDSSMTDLIRPCLYGSFHRIYPTKLYNFTQWGQFDVVGPVCETADFLGKNILLQRTLAKYLAVMDCGAYASSMSSNYNMRPKLEEYLVDGSSWKSIRNREMFQDITATYKYKESTSNATEIHN